MGQMVRKETNEMEKETKGLFVRSIEEPDKIITGSFEMYSEAQECILKTT